jgi:hypothetical protein
MNSLCDLVDDKIEQLEMEAGWRSTHTLPLNLFNRYNFSTLKTQGSASSVKIGIKSKFLHRLMKLHGHQTRARMSHAKLRLCTKMVWFSEGLHLQSLDSELYF